MTSVTSDRRQGLNSSAAIKVTCRVATTGNIALQALQTIDGIALAAGDRVLVKSQTDGTQNGIYVADTGNWTRDYDFDGAYDVQRGTLITVWEGTANGQKCYWQTTAGPITIGTTALAFVPALFSGPSGVIFTRAGAGAVNRALLDKERDWVSAQDSGAVADGATDDLAAMNTAITDAAARMRALMIPATTNNYKLSNVLSLATQSLRVVGQGIKSLLQSNNAAGAAVVELNGATHMELSDVAISGIAGSGHGVEIKGLAHNARTRNLLINLVGGSGFKVTSGQSGVHVNVEVDNNNGYNPSGSGAGTTQNAFHVASEAGQNTNNHTFIGCKSNAGSQNGYSLKVGDNGSPVVQSFAWFGGLLQGSSLHQEFYLHTTDAVIEGCHIEPPAAADAVHWVGTFDGTANTVVKNCTLAGDVQLINGCSQSGLENVNGCGVTISADSVGCFVRDMTYANIITGPAAGNVVDLSNLAELRNLVNGSNTYYAVGDNLRGRSTVFFSTRMADWYGGAAPTVPCGFTMSAGGTVAPDAVTFRTGVQSAKIVTANQATDGIQLSLDTVALGLQGRWIVIEAWCRTAGANVSALIAASYAPSGATATAADGYYPPWHRFLVSFHVPSTETLLTLRFSGTTAGSVWFDSISIRVEDFVPVRDIVLANSATPSVLSGPNMVPMVTTGDTTAITDFPDAHVGVPFTIFFKHAKTITYNAAKILLNGSVNFVGADKNTMTLMRGTDGIVRELSRMVA